jgi:hypothetical protein
LEEDVAQWARIEAARRDTSLSRFLGALLKERVKAQGSSAAEAAERLASFGQRHRLSLRGLKIKDLINEARPEAKPERRPEARPKARPAGHR